MKAKLHLPAYGSPDHPNTLVEIGGHNIAPACRSLELHVRAGHDPEMTLHLDLFDGVDVTGTFTVGIPERTHLALVALGWTPPAAATPATEK